jgi:hypothetical protein
MEDQTLRQLVEQLATETRRRFDIVAEGLRKDVQLVAEGVSSLNDQVVRLRSDIVNRLEAGRSH